MSNKKRNPQRTEETFQRSNLTKSQFLIWMGQKLNPVSSLYNVMVAFTINGKVDIATFQQAFQAVIDKSDAMRTVVQEADGIPLQRVLPKLTYNVENLDFSHLQNPETEFQNWLD
ncbi:unnamed protein product, partial [marine sediment metagenome]